jgi:GNAT superfamily N-acetyltransferase
LYPIKIIKNIEEIESLDKLIRLVQKQMTVIGGCSDFLHIKGALENALKPESRSVIFLWYTESNDIGAFAFSNICAGLETGSDYLWINELFVDDEFRKRNVASEMIQFIEKWVKENRIKYIACTTGLTNESAQKLYKKKGFDIHKTMWVDKSIE